jgi:hypothetical protein
MLLAKFNNGSNIKMIMQTNIHHFCMQKINNNNNNNNNNTNNNNNL